MSNLKNRPSSPQWMVVYITYSPEEAHIVAGRLRSEGMETLIDRAAGGNAMGITIGILGEVRVLVHPDDYDLAQDILYDDDNEVDALPDNTDQIIFPADDDDE